LARENIMAKGLRRRVRGQPEKGVPYLLKTDPGESECYCLCLVNAVAEEDEREEAGQGGRRKMYDREKTSLPRELVLLGSKQRERGPEEGERLKTGPGFPSGRPEVVTVIGEFHKRKTKS